MKEKLFILTAMGVVILGSLPEDSVLESSISPGRLTVANQIELVTNKTPKHQPRNPLGYLLIIGTVAIGVVFFLSRQNSTQVQRQDQVIAVFPEKVTSLQKKLISLVGGNSDIAQRLIMNIRTKYPEKNELWCWEKVIFDLERDRR